MRTGPGVQYPVEWVYKRNGLPVEIISECVIGAGSVVTKDCKIKGVYAGNPAKLIKRL